MDDVKDIIKRRRESLGLTLEDVAAKVNVNALIGFYRND